MQIFRLTSSPNYKKLVAAPWKNHCDPHDSNTVRFAYIMYICVSYDNQLLFISLINQIVLVMKKKLVSCETEIGFLNIT
jgi:hypothetical protein